MKSLLKLGLAGVLVIGLGTVSYYTHRLWKFSNKVSDAFEYTYAAIDCLIMEDGEKSNDIEVLYNGTSLQKAEYKKERKTRKPYSTHIPECNKFYSEYRCWKLDPYNPRSVIRCGPNFGMLQSEIDNISKETDRNKIKELLNQFWERRIKENKDK